MIYSFDVFDTCIVRTCARPTDVFYLVAEQLLAKSGRPYGREEVSELALARALAEKRAHKATPRGEITLTDIYAELGDLSAWGFSAQEMRDAEVCFEVAAMRPVVPIRTRIEALQRAGERVVFISDMYLPESAVREMLLSCGYSVPEGTLYVSSELNLTKRAGGLFKHVLEEEGIPAKELRHCGDGVESDILGARKAGVGAEIVTVTQLNRFERAMLNVPSTTPWATSQLAGIARATRLSFDGESEMQGSAEVAASVVAPLLTGFVLWVLRDAQARGLKRLYFVARDGQVLHKVAEALGTGVDAPELRYLYGSRQAWYAPSAFAVDRDELEFVLMTGQSSAPRHNLKRVNLTPEALEIPLLRHGFPKSAWETQLEGEAVERFWRFIEDPEVAPLILAEAERAREVALAYFEQEGLLKDARWALVDVGWTLRTQGSLHKVLASAGQPHTLGYYLGVSKTRFSSRAYGQGRAYLLEEAENDSGAQIRTLFENKGLIDQVFTMADHGSTRGYARVGEGLEPVLSALPVHPKREVFLRTVHELVSRFAEELAKSPVRDCEPELRACARLVTGMLIAQPTRSEARALAWAPISDDPNELRAAQLARPLSPGDLFTIARDVLSRVRRQRSGGRADNKADNRTVPTLFYKDLSWGFSWLEGSVALSGPVAKLALRSFRTLQGVNREKKALASKPFALWQDVKGRFRGQRG
ncbi:MAG: Predicted hydrolase (HAD superfamily) [uncultured Truepera sp.]|uniref:Predicted hydrolase (HAD superfamily) n=1 Tax=uncultured Truepera sp. TaxID=543023 RepID=A0A6J4V827_9DEIN|nr:MAG: Predicted hydrolase (HAD superfamily) [uncultured Truepera sp.]